ncbi:VWA domain-containing protein [Myxococcota bacterium]|nr:VWA domain-containing protein [Myxococcota bacterium]
MQSRIWSVVICSVLCLACAKPPKDTASGPKEADGAPVTFEGTIGTCDPMGAAVTAPGENGGRPFRLLGGKNVKAGGHVQIILDAGPMIIMDKDGVIVPLAHSLDLLSGRIFVRSDQEEPFTVGFPGGKLKTKSGSFSLEITTKGIILHHLKGELVLQGAKPVQLTGGSFELKGGKAIPRPNDLWIDWTGGLSREKRPSVGYGIMRGYSAGAYGLRSAASPLILRRQEVAVKIRRRVAITEVTQIFFNPSSYSRDGEYRVRIPRGASLLSASLLKDKVWVDGAMLPVSAGQYFSGDGTLYRVGEGLYGANINNMPLSGEVGVKFSYVEKLTEIHGRKFYSYAMSGGPKSGEFELAMRVLEPGAKVRAGMGGKWENRRFVIRKSDFLPRADFVAEVFPAKKLDALLELGDKVGKLKPYLLSIPLRGLAGTLGAGKKAGEKGISLVLLLDMSASMGPSRIHLIKTAFASLLEKFTPADKVAVFTLTNDVIPLDGEGLAPVSAERGKKLSENLSRLIPGGATDLGKAIETAAVMIPQGEGMIVYIGDGQPTRGAMLSDRLRSRLEMASPAPVFRSVLVGDTGRNDLLEPLGKVASGSTVSELARVLLGLMEEASRSNFKGLHVKIGSESRRITPTAAMPLGVDDTLYTLGYLAKKVPATVTVSGWFEGKHFSREIPFTTVKSSDSGVLSKMWAYSRVDDLMLQGAGTEVITALAREYGIVTPYTAWNFVLTGSVPSMVFIPYSVWDGLPSMVRYKNTLLKSLPPSSISGLALPDVKPTSYLPSMAYYYQQLLNRPQRREAVNECFNRRAVFQPQGGGLITYEFVVDADGSFKKFERKYNSLGDKKMLECIHRAISVMPRLPAPPSGKPVTFMHSYSFASTGNIIPQKCSNLAKAYISKRRGVWRQRLSGYITAPKAENEWKVALAGCELSGWLYKKALLDIILEKLTSMDKRLRFAGLMAVQGFSVTRYIREKILKSVDSPDAARQVVMHYNLHGGALMGRLMTELRKWYAKDGHKLDPKERNVQLKKMISRFHVFDPENAALTVLYARYAWLAGSKDLAISLAEGLVPRRDLTAGQREDLAEFLMTAGRKRLANIVASTSVELAPYDPWSRKRLGDFFARHNMLKDALEEYRLLAWLLPQAHEPKILLAGTLIRNGQVELGLRTYENLMLVNGNRFGKLLLLKQLAMILGNARTQKSGTQSIRARIRRNGLLAGEGESLVFFQQKHSAPLGVSYRFVDPDEKPKAPKENKKDEGPVWLAWPIGDANLGLRVISLPKKYEETALRFMLPRLDGISRQMAAKGELIVITGLWTKDQKIVRHTISPTAGTEVLFTLSPKGQLSAPSVKTLPEPKKNKEK